MVKSKGDFNIAIKSVTDGDGLGEFDGVLSTKNEVDLAGEMTTETTFTNTIREKGDKRVMLWNHNGSEPIGSITLSDNPSTLDVHGRLCLDTARGKEAYALLKSGDVPLGLSIGYVVRKSHFDSDGVKVLDDVDLLEGSVVSTPCCQSAMIDLASVKSSDRMTSKFDNLSFLRDMDDEAKAKAIAEIEDILAQDDDEEKACEPDKDDKSEDEEEQTVGETEQVPADEPDTDDEEDEKSFNALIKQINAITAKLR